MAKRHVLRTDPALKNLYCKRCNCMLSFPSPSTVLQSKQIKRQVKKAKRFIVDCQFCAYANHIPQRYRVPHLAFNTPLQEEGQE